MMYSVRKRGKVYGFYSCCNGERIQISLGTRNGDNATFYARAIERALIEGNRSQEWPRLRNLLPISAFQKLAALVGYVDEPKQPESRPPEWETDLRPAFKAECERRVSLGRLRQSTWNRYRHTISEFCLFLEQRQVTRLASVTRQVVEEFKAWRLARIGEKKFSRGARSIALDAAILHRVFSFAVELEMIARNPVRLEGRPGDDPECGAQPFRADELARLRENAGDDLLAFWFCAGPVCAVPTLCG